MRSPTDIPRWLLLGVLVAGLLATLRLGWVVRDYTGAIDTLQRVEFTIVGVTRPTPGELHVEIEIRNRAGAAIEVQSLHLNAYAASPTQVGATYAPFERLRVEGGQSARVTRVVTVINPEQIEQPGAGPGTPLRFTGRTLLRLDIGERFFARDLSLTWEAGI